MLQQAPDVPLAIPCCCVVLRCAVLRRQEDTAREPESRGSGLGAATAVHHMDPYRLGHKVDKMAGLIDFPTAFERDVCLIEWPALMPASVRALPQRGLAATVGGVGTQGAGRLVRLEPLQQQQDDAAAAAVAATLAAWRADGGIPAAPATKPSSAARGAAPGANGCDGAAGAGSMAGAGPVSVPGPAQAQVQVKGRPEEWLVLGVESSCDDTAAAVVRGDGLILAHEIASQVRPELRCAGLLGRARADQGVKEGS